MPVLKNPKYELFAQERAKGASRIRAYELAGYKPDDGNAAKLEARSQVQVRIQEITNNAAIRTEEKIAVSRAWVLERLVQNVERAMQYEEVQDRDGGTGEFQYAGNVANRSLELIGKELGMFIDRSEVGGAGEFDRLGDDELMAEIERMNGESTVPLDEETQH